MKIQNITVRTVEKQKLIDFLNVDLSQNEKLCISDFAIYEDKFAIHYDCVFWEIENKHFDNEIQAVIEIDCRIEHHKPDGSYSLRMDKADFSKTISVKDYLSLSKEVKLIDFISYNYNPRIISNQNLLMKYIKESQAVSS